MGLFNRLLLLLAALLLGTAAAAFCLCGLGCLPTAEVWNEFQYASGQVQSYLAAVIVLLMSVKLLFNSFMPSGSKDQAREAVLLKTKSGKVSVAAAAVRNLVRETALAVHGVRDVKVKLAVRNRPEAPAELKLQLDLIVGQEANVPETADSVRQAAGQRLAEVAGIEVTDISLSVREITNAPLDKKRRVV
jgi:uncharacterized alkaline shock family protein YloU